MATVASQIVFHPVLSQSLKILSTTLGRDKVYRAIQYYARFYAWVLISTGFATDAVAWTALKSHLALARKLFRLAKPLEHLQAALRATQTAGEFWEQLTAIARQLSYFGYLTYDAFVWANAIKFIRLKPVTAVRVNKIANRFWLSGILFSVVHSLVKAGRLAKEAKDLRPSSFSEKNLGSTADNDRKFHTLEVTRTVTRQQLVMDVLDVWIPATNLGLFNVNDGVLGILGFITSVMALQTQWKSLDAKK